MLQLHQLACSLTAAATLQAVAKYRVTAVEVPGARGSAKFQARAWDPEADQALQMQADTAAGCLQGIRAWLQEVPQQPWCAPGLPHHLDA